MRTVLISSILLPSQRVFCAAQSDILDDGTYKKKVYNATLISTDDFFYHLSKLQHANCCSAHAHAPLAARARLKLSEDVTRLRPTLIYFYIIQF